MKRKEFQVKKNVSFLGLYNMYKNIYLLMKLDMKKI